MASNPAEFCREPQRRQEIRQRGSNGIDYIEVSDDRLTLTVFLLSRIATPIVPANLRITGGARVRDIEVTGIRLRGPEDAEGDNSLEVAIDRPGDTSTYTLSLVELDADDRPTDQPLAGIDPRYARADFSFRLGESTDLDCKQPQACPIDIRPSPEINYLARDYGSFRQMILDRLAVTVPNWREQHVPDTGIALVEILAYVADHLSYYQDAVATEAYLSTARQRISVRRHARLVNYAMHEGCNARAFIFVDTGTQDVIINDPSSIHFVSGCDDVAPAQGEQSLAKMLPEQRDRLVIFEPMSEGTITLHAAHNKIAFYTWGDRDCCLPAGATSATLRDDWKEMTATYSEPKPPSYAQPQPYTKPKLYAQPQEKRSPRKRSAKSKVESEPESPPPKEPSKPPGRERKLNLRPGDILLFEELRGPDTGRTADADPAHRHLVRLTEVKQGYDPLFDRPVLEIAWAPEDALPFPLRLSGATGSADGADISVARGNMILADHGNWTDQGSRIVYEELPAPESGKKFRPTLKAGPLTYRDRKVGAGAAMTQLLRDPRSAVPQLIVQSIPPTIDGAKPLFTFADLQDPAPLVAGLAATDDVPSRNFQDRLKGAWSDPARASRIADLGDAEAAEAVKDKLKRLLRTWTPQPDLLSSSGSDCHFVVEMDDHGVAHLRFGDGQTGRAPEIGERFAATYRVGIGAGGNVGADTITQIVRGPTAPREDLASRNPLPAMGGTDPEPIEKVKLLAPKASQNGIVRAIRADDYARLAERNPRVQRAAAELQWTGARYEAHVAIDPLGTETADPALLRQIRAYLYRYRRIGHDVIVVPPTYVPVDIAITVHVLAGYARGHIETLLRNIFSARKLPDGRLGFFHPDNLSFGDSIYASKLVAAAQRVEGVESVVVTRLHRRFQAPDHELVNGILPIGPLEIARLGSNRPSPEDGRLVLTVRGGR